MNNEKKMPSLSLSDGFADSQNEEINGQVSGSDDFDADAYNNESTPEQNPYFVNMGEVAFTSGPSSVTRKKKHTGRNVFLAVLLLAIVGALGTYMFVPRVKNAVNSRLLTPKAYFEWSLGNSIKNAVKLNDNSNKTLDGTTFTVTDGKNFNASLYNDSDNMLVELKFEDSELKAYVDKKKSLKYLSAPTKDDIWYCIDDKYYNGQYNNMNYDFNSCFDASQMNSLASDILKSFVKNSTHLQKETGASENIHGKVYDATKIYYTMTGKQCLKFISEACFTVADNENALKYLEGIGVSRDNVLKIANNANMTQKGLTGSTDFQIEFVWYVNCEGIISGFEADYKAGNESVKYCVLFAKDESGADLTAYVEEKNERPFKIDMTSEFADNKANGTLAVVAGGEEMKIGFSNLEIVNGEFLNGLNGEITAGDESVVLSYNGSKQVITFGEESIELGFEKTNTADFVCPVTDNVSYIYTDLDLFKILF